MKSTEQSNRRKEIFKIIKFAVIGFLSTVVEVALFYVLQGIVFRDMLTQPIRFLFFEYEGPGYLWSFLISTVVGYAIAFVLNRKITFQANANPVFSVIAYILMVVFTIFVTTWLGIAITNLFIRMDRRSLGELIAKPFVALLAIVWTYPINRFIIHRKKAPPEPGTNG